jgi:hypothetical protein
LNGEGAIPDSDVDVAWSSSAVEALTRWPEAVGLVVLAAGLVCLARLAGARTELPSKLALAALTEALLLIGIALAGVMHADTAYDIQAVLTSTSPVRLSWLQRARAPASALIVDSMMTTYISCR